MRTFSIKVAILGGELWVLGSGVPVMMMFRGKLLKPT